VLPITMDYTTHTQICSKTNYKWITTESAAYFRWKHAGKAWEQDFSDSCSHLIEAQPAHREILYTQSNGNLYASISFTNPRLASFSLKGAMGWPSYFLIIPANAGTAPGTFASETRDMRPSIAKRPLFTSMLSFLAFCSSESFS